MAAVRMPVVPVLTESEMKLINKGNWYEGPKNVDQYTIINEIVLDDGSYFELSNGFIVKGEMGPFVVCFHDYENDIYRLLNPNEIEEAHEMGLSVDQHYLEGMFDIFMN